MFWTVLVFGLCISGFFSTLRIFPHERVFAQCGFSPLEHVGIYRCTVVSLCFIFVIFCVVVVSMILASSFRQLQGHPI